MSIDSMRLLIDFGLVVLIWMVQRVVYPGFLYYDNQNLIRWHKQYVANFQFIVIPLMFAQLGISLYQVFIDINVYTVVSLILVVLVWLSTFMQFVPIHAKISKEIISQGMLNELVTKNWIRTALWTLVFIMSCFYFY